jgi:hypothetical protein
MFSADTTIIGLYLSSARPPFSFVALNDEKRVLAQGQGSLEDVLAYCAGQRRALLAINAPYQVNVSLSAQVVDDLARRGLHLPLAVARPEADSSSSRRSLATHQRLEALGYQPFDDSGEAARRWVEVQPEICFWAWLGKPLLDGRSLEGRLQRQLILNNEGWPAPDPMDFFEEITRHRLLNGLLPLDQIYSLPRLNALAAAATAWLVTHKPETTLLLGEDGQRCFHLPVAELPAVPEPLLPTLFPLG